MTIVALYNWPWHWSVADDQEAHFQIDERGLRVRDADSPSKGSVDEITRLRRSLLFAAVATILRPTNILIWSSLAYATFLRRDKVQWFVKVPGTGQSALVDMATWALIPSTAEVQTLVREAIVCGSAVLSLSAIVDRLFYGIWTFPPLNFLNFNVVQSLSIFYGNNNWHYYLSQGYPLLLITALPSTLVGMYQALTNSKDYWKLSLTSQNTLSNLTAISIFVPAVLSIISHKEVRFIYPLLPGLHILAAKPVADFFATSFQQVVPSSRQAQLYKRLLLGFLLSINFFIAFYTASIHNSGLVNVTHYLRHEFERYYDTNASTPVMQNGNGIKNMTVGFLTPCHSTPWRSHLQYAPTSTHRGIDAWALTCEPPLGLNTTEKAAYLDEADLFYADPEVWLKRHMSRHPPTPAHSNHRKHEPGVFAVDYRPRRMFEIEVGHEEGLWRERKGRRPWPEYLVFFEQLEPLMKRVGVQSSGYVECKRVWNSRVHEDWRRKGDVVVWCLYPERKDEKRVKEEGEERRERLRVEVEKVKRRVEQVEKVVERPFWKQRPLMGEGLNGKGKRWFEGPWEWVARMMGLRKEKQTKKEWGSWWEGGDWS